MLFFTEIWSQARSFLESGGDILTIIALVTFVLWFLIFERFLFFKKEYPVLQKEITDKWSQRSDKTSWKALRQRDQIISSTGIKLFERIDIIDKGYRKRNSLKQIVQSLIRNKLKLND